MKSKATARKYKSPVVDQFLDGTSPTEKLQISTKMVLAARLDDLLTERGWSRSVFAEKVNKSPSEITKWLSGTQNFTIDTLSEITVAFNVSISELFASPTPSDFKQEQLDPNMGGEFSHHAKKVSYKRKILMPFKLFRLSDTDKVNKDLDTLRDYLEIQKKELEIEVKMADVMAKNIQSIKDISELVKAGVIKENDKIQATINEMLSFGAPKE